MTKKLVSVQGGEVFAIPLFVSGEPDNKSFARENFAGKGEEFAYCRVIDDLEGSGILIEVFARVGGLDQTEDVILSAKRLFPPVTVSGLGIYKKRWKKVLTQKNYDRERDSNFSDIRLVIGIGDNLRLWQCGKETQVSENDVKHYEKMIIWRASQLEKRIKKALDLENR